MAELNGDVRFIKGIGEQRARKLAGLGISTLRDLVSYFPRAYEDRRVFRPISELTCGESACVRAMVASTPRLSRARQGLELVKLRVVDDGGSLDITYFNQPYVQKRLVPGEIYIFYGRVEGMLPLPSMSNPEFERESEQGESTRRILPRYRLKAGISPKVMRAAVRQGLDACGDRLPEPLPDELRERLRLCPARYAYENIHFPSDFEALGIARRRLIFEELFVLACAMGRVRGGREKRSAVPFGPCEAEEFYASLPFEPTRAQRRAFAESAEDMRSGRPMNRLLQGDVGSGKTLVAAACVWYTHKNGGQSAFMAPTEILTEQHFATLKGFLEPFGIKVARLCGSMSAKEKRETRALLASGEAALVVGTHALLTESVSFRSLRLVITDEQHRFGVEQRASLVGKGERPHTLVMSATPIPRTLAMMIYGDLDVSVLDELPPGRQRVDTFVVSGGMRPRVNNFIRRVVSEGRQVFVVCPMIEENEEYSESLKSAESHAAELRDEFPELRVACVHGRLKAGEKDAVMAAFARGESDVLVSTTVIEVGVDVPNAALMIVENAERFGLSQLHQLRGRVGRGEHKSFCVLISDSRSEDTRARLGVLRETSDGFRISEEDLRLRGPGDFFGSRQHGLPELRVADLCADMDVLKSAQSEAARLLGEDEGLEAPENQGLRERVEELMRSGLMC